MSWLNFQQGSCVGLYFINRPEWPIVDHACSAYSYISVPLYDTLGLFLCNFSIITTTKLSIFAVSNLCIIIINLTGPDAVKYIVNHAILQVIFCVPQTLDVVSLAPFFKFCAH